MLPGLIAGHYTKDESHIDLKPLARFARARAVFDEAIGLDLANRLVHVREQPPIAYDVLSIDIGSTPNLAVTGAAEHTTPVKPIDRFLDRWSTLTTRLCESETIRRIAVVGGGVGGVELLLAVQHSMHTRLAKRGRSDRYLEYHLFTDADLLPTHNRSVRRRFERILADRHVHVHQGSAVVDVAAGMLHTADGRAHPNGQAQEVGAGLARERDGRDQRRREDLHPGTDRLLLPRGDRNGLRRRVQRSVGRGDRRTGGVLR